MIIRTLNEIQDNKSYIVDPKGNWTSYRLLVDRDKMGFSFHVTVISAHCLATMEYKHHLEACYCIEGSGEITDSQGKTFPITPGTLYALDKHDRHVLRAKSKMTLISIFNPAVVGHEVHDESGSYPAPNEQRCKD